MDLQAVREEAIEATTRAFWDRNGLVPDQDSDEWEEEYRRQFEQAKRRHAAGQPAEVKPARAVGVPLEEEGWAVLTGAPTQIRWAAALRADRSRRSETPGVRDWLATTWTKAKSWIDTRELPTPVFLQTDPTALRRVPSPSRRARPRIDAEEKRKSAAAEALQREIEAAGITVEGLIELIDIAERLPSVPIKEKLAELECSGRNLRVFETADPAVLMVLEKAEAERSDYGIERDDGLVADLKLYRSRKSAFMTLHDSWLGPLTRMPSFRECSMRRSSIR